MDELKEAKVEMLLHEDMGGMMQFRPLGIGYPPEVWEAVTERSKPRTWSGCCCDLETAVGTMLQITRKLRELGYSTVFVP